MFLSTNKANKLLFGHFHGNLFVFLYFKQIPVLLQPLQQQDAARKL